MEEVIWEDHMFRGDRVPPRSAMTVPSLLVRCKIRTFGRLAVPPNLSGQEAGHLPSTPIPAVASLGDIGAEWRGDAIFFQHSHSHLTPQCLRGQLLPPGLCSSVSEARHYDTA